MLLSNTEIFVNNTFVKGEITETVKARGGDFTSYEAFFLFVDSCLNSGKLNSSFLLESKEETASLFNVSVLYPNSTTFNSVNFFNFVPSPEGFLVWCANVCKPGSSVLISSNETHVPSVVLTWPFKTHEVSKILNTFTR